MFQRKRPTNFWRRGFSVFREKVTLGALPRRNGLGIRAVVIPGAVGHGNPELVAEIRTAASTLSTAADAAQSGDLAATAIAIEDVLFRVESILSRIRLMKPPADQGGTPPVTNGRSSDA